MSLTRRCDNCGRPLTVENYAEATITSGPCGYLYAAHFGGGEVQEEPCKLPPSPVPETQP